jgi:hypothetical protein
MTPFWIPRQGASLNRKRHTKLRLAITYSTPWLLLGGVTGAVVGWLISLFI